MRQKDFEIKELHYFHDIYARGKQTLDFIFVRKVNWYKSLVLYDKNGRRGINDKNIG